MKRWIFLMLMVGMVRVAGMPPNVLFLVADDLNDWVGVLGGHRQVKTPHLDGLGARGVVFTNAHCQAPLCNPSRTSVLLGLRPSRTGIHGLAPGVRKVAEWRDRVSLPQAFRRAGYATYSCGKVWHDGALGAEEMAAEFERTGPAPGMPRPGRRLSGYPSKLAAMDWGVYPASDDENADGKIAAAACEALRTADAGRPFFVACGFRLPHVPCYAPQRWFDLYPDQGLVIPEVREDDRMDTPAFSWLLHWKLPEPRLVSLRRHGEWRPLVRAYLASVSAMDAMVGRVLAALEATGRAGNTVVVFWSDHGWHLGEKGITGKNSLWERSTRVPLLVAGPGVVSGGRCREAVELLDLFPTLTDLCGIGAVEGLDGMSLRAQLENPGVARERPALTTHNQGNHSVRDRRWRYIRYADGSEELYDLEKDPNEWENLAGRAEYAGRKRALAEWLPKVDVPCVPGSAHRILRRPGGVGLWEWEGKPVDPAQAVPGMDD
ncbi:MAG: Arylsulfatase A [Verrucomicrobia bacterium]|nr:MAG: Arylsulfatase A [Verrucomicrobiota bacterium]